MAHRLERGVAVSLTASSITAFALKYGFKALVKIPAVRKGYWRGHCSIEKTADGWIVTNDTADPCRLYVPALGLDYAFGVDGKPFATDLGSIPEILQGAKYLHLKPDDYPKTYTTHDWGYKFEGIYVSHPDANDWHFVRVDRREADIIMYIGLCSEGATLADSQAIYRGVRMFGNSAWQSHRREDAAKA